MPAGVWTSFLRLATNRRVFEVPTPREEAFAFITAMFAAIAVENGCEVATLDRDFARFESVGRRRPGA